MAACACLPWPALAQSGNINGIVALSSQLVDRGLAVTSDTAIVQGAVSWTLPSGWAFGVAASTEVRNATPLAETFAQASHTWRMTPDWQFAATAAYYDYPGRGNGAFNRAEGGANWIYRDVLTLGIAAMIPTGGGNHQLRGAADVDFHWPLPWHVSFSAGAGYAQTQVPTYGTYDDEYGSHRYPRGDRVNSYGYGHLGLIWAQGPWRVEVDRVFVDASMREAWLAASPWVATMSWSF
ncbi:hypothetical protein HY57_06555 [Dyella japonica A8]|uniref:Uncharacterized protein n=2 Tax=Dyella japonica TaxID=231455 RepID=A0A075JXY7_9GAMM|nr:hypothetical protein HY57_06555 [Dyella japonica A8]